MVGFVKKLLPAGVVRKLKNVLMGPQWLDHTYFSQFGEDVLLRNYFHRQAKGFFVDVGAYQPVSLSNTYYFYLKGWRGVNIEPNPEAIEQFQQYRGEDRNVQMGVYKTPGMLQYIMMKDKPFENSFSSSQVDARSNTEGISKIIDVQVNTLEHILELNVPAGQEIDFISIDVEGLNLEVVESGNWERFKPKVAVIEKHGTEEQDKNDKLIALMTAAGYMLDYDIMSSYFFCLPQYSLRK